jgi:deoxycytidylate deaminase
MSGVHISCHCDPKNLSKNALQNYFQNRDEMQPRNINSKHLIYIEKAAKLALKSTMAHKHGCVLVNDDDGMIVSQGYNRSTTIMYHTYSIHAEVDTLMKLKKKANKAILPKCIMYVVRIGPQQELKYSKPCENCQKAILKYGIKSVYYSTGYSDS